MGRTENAAKNVVANLAGNGINIALKFISRTVFIYTLGSEYLGIGSLFGSILSILDLAELGVGSAISYSMYQPLAEKNEAKVCALLKLYKKAYTLIGMIILVAGLLLFPALPYIMGEKTQIINVNLIFAMYLFQTVVSYLFFSYRTSIVYADQKGYKLTGLDMVVSVLTMGLQCVILILFQNYVVYLTIGIVMTIGKNMVAVHLVHKMYPYIKTAKAARLEETEKADIRKNVFGLTMYKISTKVLTSTDNIIISAFVSLAAVGLYDNYNYIWLVATGFCMILFNSYTPGIGNLYATESKERLEEVFQALNFANFCVYGICGTMVYVLATPFIQLWLGADYVLGEAIVIAVVLNFLTAGLQNAVITYKDACGLFYQGRWRPVCSAVVNLMISLVLVQFYGIAGVVWGTIISRILTTWWFDAWMVHHYVFGHSAGGYYRRYWGHLIYSIVVAAAVKQGTVRLNRMGGIAGFLVTAVVGVAVTAGVYWLCFHRTREYQYCRMLAVNIWYKIKKKVGK